MGRELLTQLKLGEWRDEEELPSQLVTMTEREDGIRRLKGGRLRVGEATVNIQVLQRVGKTDHDLILELRLSQFQHGTRRKRENSLYLCTQRVQAGEEIDVWLQLQPTTLAAQLLKPGEWAVGDRQLPPNGKGWSAVVSDYAGKKEIRFWLIYVDPKATRVNCRECCSLGWECDKVCACSTASKSFTVEAGWVSLAQILAILRWMRENRPLEAWYPLQAIGQRPFHEHASVLEDCVGPGMNDSHGAEMVRRKMEQKEWQHPASPPRAKVDRPHWDPPEQSGLISFDFTEAEHRELPFDETVWRRSSRVFIGDKEAEQASQTETDGAGGEKVQLAPQGMDRGRPTAPRSYQSRAQQDQAGEGPVPVPGLVLLAGPRPEPQD
eukprot:3219826-Rhodomonas_salina.2